ncbi:MAG: response regulator [Anaerolineales bacterium]|nr:response regulator [Anaerolineales bacterium]
MLNNFVSDEHTILVVDDNPTNLKLLSDYLADIGFRILVAQDGESAIEKVRYAQPDLILLDVMMPRMDGFETCRQLKADTKTHDVPIIFMTALTGTHEKVMGFRLGAVDYITKPFQPEEVVARVKTHLQLHAMRKQAEAQNTQLQQEISERKQTEAKLAERTTELAYERAQLQAILDSVGEGVIYDEHFQAQYINRALERMTGYTLQEWAGYLDPLTGKGMTPQALAKLTKEIRTHVAQEGVWRGEVGLRRKQGEEFDAALTYTPLVDPSGESTCGVTLVRDISQEKTLQAQKDRFIATASHELRTPIASLKLHLYLLRKDPHALEKKMDIFEEVIGRMERLVEDLLSISRFERGLIDLRKRNVLLQQLVDDVIRSQLPFAADKNIHLASDLIAEPVYGFFDPDRIFQAITNLVGNAINYTPEDGQIDVQLVSNSHNAYIHIYDTGIGIAPEDMSQIFEPFFRVEENAITGTGLGLGIAKEIVESHGGEITVKSTLGQGSVFSIRLPV